MFLLFVLAQSHLAEPPPDDDGPPPKFQDQEMQNRWEEYGNKIQALDRRRRDLIRIREEGKVDTSKYEAHERQLGEQINDLRRQRRRLLEKAVPPAKGFEGHDGPPIKELPPHRAPPNRDADPRNIRPPEKPAPGEGGPPRKEFDPNRFPPVKEGAPERFPPGKDIERPQIPRRNGGDPPNFPPKKDGHPQKGPPKRGPDDVDLPLKKVPPLERRAAGEERPPRKEIEQRNFAGGWDGVPGKEFRRDGGDLFEDKLRHVLQRIERLRGQSDQENPRRKEELELLENEASKIKEARKKAAQLGGDLQQKPRKNDAQRKPDVGGGPKKPVAEESSGIWGFFLTAAVLVAAGFGLIALLKKTVCKKWRQKKSDKMPLAFGR